VEPSAEMASASGAADAKRVRAAAANQALNRAPHAEPATRWVLRHPACDVRLWAVVLQPASLNPVAESASHACPNVQETQSFPLSTG